VAGVTLQRRSVPVHPQCKSTSHINATEKCKIKQTAGKSLFSGKMINATGIHLYANAKAPCLGKISSFDINQTA